VFEKLRTPEDVFGWQLGTALTMERAILGALNELVHESRSEEVREALLAHKEETREHEANVEAAFQALNWEIAEESSDAAEAIAKQGKSEASKAEPPLIDRIILGAAIETEHYEIAVYENLILQARALSLDAVIPPLKANLESERGALEKVSKLASRGVPPAFAGAESGPESASVTSPAGGR